MASTASAAVIDLDDDDDDVPSTSHPSATGSRSAPLLIDSGPPSKRSKGPTSSLAFPDEPTNLPI